MKNPIQPIIDGLDERKKKLKKTRFSPTPGVMATEIMLAECEGTGVDKKTNLERLAAIKAQLKIKE